METLVAEFKFSNFVIDAMRTNPEKRAALSAMLNEVGRGGYLHLSAVERLLSPFGLTYDGTTYEGRCGRRH